MRRTPIEIWTRERFTSAVDHALHNPHDAVQTQADIARQIRLRRAQGTSPISLNAGLRRSAPREPAGSASSWIATEVILTVAAASLLGSGLLAGLSMALGWIVVLGAPALALLFLAGLANTARFRADDRRSRQGRCARCGFDLRGLPEPLPARLLAGQVLGAPRCPECGLDWPRVARLPSEP